MSLELLTVKYEVVEHVTVFVTPFRTVKYYSNMCSNNIYNFKEHNNGFRISRLGTYDSTRKSTMERRVERRVLRDAQNPFDLPRNEFINIFRISPDLALEITNLVMPDLIRQRSTGVSPEIQVILFLCDNVFSLTCTN